MATHQEKRDSFREGQRLPWSTMTGEGGLQDTQKKPSYQWSLKRGAETGEDRSGLQSDPKRNL